MTSNKHSCLIHCEDCSGPFKRFLESRRQWLELDGRQKEVAIQTTRIISLEDEDGFDYQQFAFHRKCYLTFTNKTILNRGETRCKKAAKKQQAAQKSSGESGSNGERLLVPKPKKVLRSTFKAGSSSRSRSEHVLLPVCIICKKNTYYSDTVRILKI